MDGNNPKQDLCEYESDTLKLIVRRDDGVRNIFLSSTTKDLFEYRNAAQDVLLRRAKISCFLSEDWIGGGDILQLCRDHINESYAYIGVFAYYYGTILEGCTESATHLEFKYACEKWGTPNPRINILMPREPDSRAQKDLMSLALKQLNCKEQVELDEHKKLLSLFHEEVKKGRQMIDSFDDYEEFREKVIVIGMNLRITALEAALGKVEVREKIEPEEKVSLQQLGLLGRVKQLDDLEKVINLLPLFPGVPAVAFLISGKEGSGHEEFLEQIIKTNRISTRPTKIVRPLIGQYDFDSMIQAVGELLGVFADDKKADNLEELAALIHAELQNQQLSLIINQIEAYDGKLAAFYETFWTPLFKELEKRQTQRQTTNRLILVLVDYSGNSAQWASITAEYGAGNLTQNEYSKLFLLQLSDITAPDLLNWFAVVKVPNENRGDLINIALNDASGNPDGTPFLVFGRLKRQNLWKK